MGWSTSKICGAELWPRHRKFATLGFWSLCDNPVFGRFCRARLQAGTISSSTCSPKGERYRARSTVPTYTLKAHCLDRDLCQTERSGPQEGFDSLANLETAKMVTR